MDYLKTDVLVIGAGAAGLVTALELEGRDVIVMAKAPSGEGSSSAWAQGGIAAAVASDDHPTYHKRDTLDVAVDLACEQAVHTVTHEGPELIDALIAWGVEFDRDVEGNLSLGREAAHSFRRILHAKGDGTGKEIMRALGQAVLHAPHIRVIDNVVVHDLIKQDNRIVGAQGITQTGQDIIVQANAVVLATGGVGNLFGFTTNPKEACGEGIAMAAKVGAVLADLEFVQFHPTAIDVGVKPMPLATEALRGEGAHLIDGKGVRFMPAIHKDAELAPRDVVARAIWRRTKSSEKVYLDCTQSVGAEFPQRFPTVWAYCQDAGLDPRVEPIPVTPAAHYHMGGVRSDLNGRTSLSGLWAVGEVACTGLHGANRLASNSLLEAVVLGRRAAQDIAQLKADTFIGEITPIDTGNGTEDLSTRLASVLYAGAGVERSQDGMMVALRQVSDWLAREKTWSAPFYNRLLVAKMILCAGLMRKESRGGHFRADFPETDPAHASRQSYLLEEINQLTQMLLDESTKEGNLELCQTQV